MTCSDFVGGQTQIAVREAGRPDKACEMPWGATEDVFNNGVGRANFLVAVVPRQLCQLKQVQRRCNLMLAKDRFDPSSSRCAPSRPSDHMPSDLDFSSNDACGYRARTPTERRGS
jgi:hypothetical protein